MMKINSRSDDKSKSEKLLKERLQSRGEEESFERLEEATNSNKTSSVKNGIDEQAGKLVKDAKYNSVRRPFNIYYFLSNGKISMPGYKTEHKQLNEAELRRAKSKQCYANQNENIKRTHNTEPGKKMKNQLAQEHFLACVRFKT
ncbi:hypothetical protein F511_15250 [Dorcoceras hygrometricum]|uniref:Uncharacterized protein n=1 Tax=Dorcoceras hygrometricum TaxID=472368 RepID=A0A2Z7D736_9LAMI|nr:hypothetical protein F511_15250 [Dorcoceras hygrometricum]